MYLSLEVLGLIITTTAFVISFLLNIAQFRSRHKNSKEANLLKKRELNVEPIKIHKEVLTELLTFVNERYISFMKGNIILSLKFPILDKYKSYFITDEELMVFYHDIDEFKNTARYTDYSSNYDEIITNIASKTEAIIELLRSRIKKLEAV
jgi:hypothetical protein